MDTDRRNIDVKNRIPLAPPGISPRTIRNNVTTCMIAVITVRIVLCRNRAKYNVAIKLPAYEPDTNKRGFENACRKNTMNPVRKQKL